MKTKVVHKKDMVLLVDSNNAICGIFSNEKEAQQKQGVVEYNLSKGNIPAWALPPRHTKQNRRKK